jgi:hypothetical protein
MFIKLGERVINVNRVGHANLDDGGRVTIAIDGESLEFEGTEAELLREHFTEEWFGMRAIAEGAEGAMFIDLNAARVEPYRR